MPQSLWEKASPYVLGGLIGAPLGAGAMGTFGPQYADIQDPAERNRKRRSNMLMGGVLGGMLGVGGGAAYDMSRNVTPSLASEAGKNVYTQARALSTHPYYGAAAGLGAASLPGMINKRMVKDVKLPDAVNHENVMKGDYDSLKGVNSHVEQLKAKGLFNRVDPVTKSQILNNLQYSDATVKNLAEKLKDTSYTGITDHGFKAEAKKWADAHVSSTGPYPSAADFEAKLRQHLSNQRAAGLSPEVSGLKSFDWSLKSPFKFQTQTLGEALAAGPHGVGLGFRQPRLARAGAGALGAYTLSQMFNQVGRHGMDEAVLGDTLQQSLAQRR